MRRSVVIWDIENIGFTRISEIIPIIPADSQKFVVSKRPLKHSVIDELINNYDFSVMKADKHINADEKIKAIMKIIELNTTELYIISSDSDFVESVSNLNIPSIHFIFNDKSKKRILMYVNLTDKRFKFHSLIQNSKPRVKNQKPLRKYNDDEKSEIKIQRLEKKEVRAQILRSLKRVIPTYTGVREKVKLNGITYHLTFDEYIDKETNRIVQRFNSQPIGICNICFRHGKVSSYKNAVNLCINCQKELIHENMIYKPYELSADEIFLRFYNAKTFEMSINGKITYTYEDFDLLEREISKIKIPDVFLKEEKTVYYSSDEIFYNPFDMLKNKV